MKWFDGGERWNEKIQIGEENNTVKQNSVSIDTVDVSDMAQIANIQYQEGKHNCTGIFIKW